MNTRSDVEPAATRISTGISGLDEILYGGLLAGRSYLVRGGPGCGKTTLGLHFLTCGSANGETVLFMTLAEPELQLRENAQRAGFDLEGVTFLDLSPDVNFFLRSSKLRHFLARRGRARADYPKNHRAPGSAEAAENLYRFDDPVPISRQ